MKRVVACLVLAVAVAGCGGGESVGCGPLVEIYDEALWSGGDELQIEAQARIAGCNEEIDAFRLEYFGSSGPRTNITD